MKKNADHTTNAIAHHLDTHHVDKAYDPVEDIQKRGALSVEHHEIQHKLLSLYADLFMHDGFGSINVEMRFLKRTQKEIIISCGKEYRFVVDWPNTDTPAHQDASNS